MREICNVPQVSGAQLADATARALEPLTPSERSEFLEYLEAKARREGDFLTIRGIKAYRASLNLVAPPVNDSK
jgi:hypothetical protein